MKKNSAGTLFFENQPRIIGNYSIVGSKEAEGPLSKYFDKAVKDCSLGEKTYEKAENKLLMSAIDGVIKNAKLEEGDIDVLIGGDLLNQIVSCSFAARCYQIPFLGIYGACSTMAESLILGASLVNAGYFNRTLCATASHFATAERQFRGPLELGSQRAPCSQWTVTGAGCSIVGNDTESPRITAATIGKVEDYGIADPNNMGAAMAPAVRSTLLNHFDNTSTLPEDYDYIVTGDLGKLGSDILRELMKEEGIELRKYLDCGHMIYSDNQKVSQGGSGCGCSAVVFNGYFMKKLRAKELRKILFIATGALMSLTTSQQGESIPGIAHAVVIEA